jgi:hypothetical protein
MALCARILVTTLFLFLEKQEINEKRRSFNLEPKMLGINYGRILQNFKFKDVRICETKTNTDNFITAHM